MHNFSGHKQDQENPFFQEPNLRDQKLMSISTGGWEWQHGWPAQATGMWESRGNQKRVRNTLERNRNRGQEGPQTDQASESCLIPPPLKSSSTLSLSGLSVGHLCAWTPASPASLSESPRPPPPTFLFLQNLSWFQLLATKRVGLTNPMPWIPLAIRTINAAFPVHRWLPQANTTSLIFRAD